MILLSELSRRRIRSVQKLIRVGRNEVVVVLRVDEEKGKAYTNIHIHHRHIENWLARLLPGYIDLSKRRVTPEDIAKCEEKYNKSKAVHSILRHVAEKHDIALEELYQTIGWPLYRKFGHAYDAFKLAITYVEYCWLLSSWTSLTTGTFYSDPDLIFEGMDIQPEILKELVSNIKRRMTPQPVKIRARKL